MTDSKQLNQKLIKRFPELNKKFCEETEWQEGEETGISTLWEGNTDYLDHWIMNRKMKKIFDKLSSNLGTDKLKIDAEGLERLFYPQLRKVKDCIIISEKSTEEMEPYFENAVKMYMDKTGYEAANTETRINCYFKNKITQHTGVRIARIVLSIWAIRLKKLEPESQFCLIMCSNKERVEIRFHKVRENEPKWLADDLEAYKDGAVGYVII